MSFLNRVWLFCDPIDCSPPRSSVHGISQAKIPEWVAISYSRGSSPSRDWTSISSTGRWILYHWDTKEAPSIIARLRSNATTHRNILNQETQRSHINCSMSLRQSQLWVPLRVPTAICPEGSLEAKRQSLSSRVQLTLWPDSDKETPWSQRLDPGQFLNQASGWAPNCTGYQAQWILSLVHAWLGCLRTSVNTHILITTHFTNEKSFLISITLTKKASGVYWP